MLSCFLTAQEEEEDAAGIVSPSLSSLPKYREKRLRVRNYDERTTRQSRELWLARPAAVESFLKIKWTKFRFRDFSLQSQWGFSAENLKKRKPLRNKHRKAATHTHTRNFNVYVSSVVGSVSLLEGFVIFIAVFLLLGKRKTTKPDVGNDVGSDLHIQRCFFFPA
jgi:hypothetical protein